MKKVPLLLPVLSLPSPILVNIIEDLSRTKLSTLSFPRRETRSGIDRTSRSGCPGKGDANVEEEGLGKGRGEDDDGNGHCTFRLVGGGGGEVVEKEK